MKLFRNKSFISIIAVILAVLMTIGVSASAFDSADTDVHLLRMGQSDRTYYLGESDNAPVLGESTYIESPEDLKTLSNLVNSGGDVSTVKYVLNTDIFMGDIEDWEPIGTQENPFNGYFDGQDHIIGKFGTESHPSLFGHINGGTLKNITISLSEDAPVDIPNSGLFIHAVNATIENCKTITDRVFGRILFSQVAPDYSWFAGETSKNFVIDSAAGLVGLAHILENDGVKNVPGVTDWSLTDANLSPGFAGGTINLADDIDMSVVGELWEGIGSVKKPFSGSVVGGGVKNLNLNIAGKENLGLFAYAKDAVFTNIKVQDSHIVGGNAVGLLVGKMEGTTVSACMSAGSVQGTNAVGGLIGEITFDEAIVSQFSSVTWSYSTADVKGIMSLGGLIGATWGTDASTISQCFTTGNVSGALNIGGIIGFARNSIATGINENITIEEVASMGNIKGIADVGGIVGLGIFYLPRSQYTYSTALKNVYTAGKVSGNLDIGGIMGKDGAVDGAYVSGHVVAPIVSLSDDSGTDPIYSEGDYVNYAVGLQSQSKGMYAESNTIYSSDNIMNKTDYENAYKRGKSGQYDEKVIFFEDNNNAKISAKFTAASLEYKDEGTSAVRPTKGHYPELNSFKSPASGNSDIDKAFKEFSEISTNVVYKSIPEYLYYSDGYVSDEPGGQPIELPTVSSGWRINGGSSFSMGDTTISEEENTIEISGNKMTMTAPFLKQQELVLTSEIAGLDGFEIKHNVIVVDESNRPNYTAFPQNIYTDKEKAKAPTANLFGPKTYLTYIPFDEIIQLKDTTGSPTEIEAEITEYSNMDFTGTIIKSKVTVTVSNNSSIRIVWPGDFLKYNKSYEVGFPKDGIVDEKGNGYNEKLFFKTPENLAPKISFNPDYAMAKYEGSTIVGDKQVLVIPENDVNFFMVTDGITIDDERFVSSDQIIITSSRLIHSAGGKEEYPTVVLEGTPTQSPNFYLVPGEYEYKFRVADPEDPTNEDLMSEEITRTYKVEGETTLLQGGGNLKPMYVVFDEEEVAGLAAKAKKEGITTQKAFELALEARYLKTKNAEQLEAYGYDSKGDKVERKITFDTSVITSEVLKTGYESIISFSVEGGESYNFNISLAGRLPDKEILPTNLNFVVKNKLSKIEMKKHIAAKVVRRSNPDIVLDDEIFFDFSKVDPRRFDIAQEVTLSLHPPRQPIDPDDVISAIVTVTFVKDIPYVHPEERWVKADAERDEFWIEKLDRMRESKADKTININTIFYDGARVPDNFFLVLNNQDNLSVEIMSENGYKLMFKTKTTDVSTMGKISRQYNFNVEDMYSLDIERDAKGAVTQQFFTQEIGDIPGTVEVTIPVVADLPTGGLAMYSIHEDTNEYVLEQKISSKDLEDDQITVVLDSFKGEYIITSGNLAGVKSSYERDYLSVK